MTLAAILAVCVLLSPFDGMAAVRSAAAIQSTQPQQDSQQTTPQPQTSQSEPGNQPTPSQPNAQPNSSQPGGQQETKQSGPETQPPQTPADSSSSSKPTEIQPPKPQPAKPKPAAASQSAAKKRRAKRKPPASASTGPTKVVVRNGGTADPAAQISPGLTVQQAASQRQNTGQLLANADANLKTIAGRQLSPGQQDMVKQIHQYAEQAQTALNAGDTERAYNLAVKAQLLSEELAKH